MKSFVEIQKDYINWFPFDNYMGSFVKRKEIKLIKKDFPLLNPCWLWPMTAPSFVLVL